MRQSSKQIRKDEIVENEIPQSAIESIAEFINLRSNKHHGIPIIGNAENAENPHIFEIISFDKIDSSSRAFFAIDGSYVSHSFYNGISLGLYRGGYICFKAGKQVRMNNSDDPIILGKAYMPQKILILQEEHLFAMYDELLTLEPVRRFLDFLKASFKTRTGNETESIFAYSKEVQCATLSSLLGFCQEILEWSLVYEIACRDDIEPGDIIMRDGTLRSLYIKQEFLVDLGAYLKSKMLNLLAVTKNSPIKLELTYTFRQIDNYLQEDLKSKYPFNEQNPQRQKLCCWFEIPSTVLSAAYGGNAGNMYIKKDIKGGRGIGIFFAARLDYVEKLQNYDWVIIDLNIFNVIPGIGNKQSSRNLSWLADIFLELTRTTQEHYILGYPYPLAEVHNLVTLRGDFKEEVVNRVKAALYSTQYVDHVDIENMFLDIHSRF